MMTIMSSRKQFLALTGFLTWTSMKFLGCRFVLASSQSDIFLNEEKPVQNSHALRQLDKKVRDSSGIISSLSSETHQQNERDYGRNQRLLTTDSWEAELNNRMESRYGTKVSVAVDGNMKSKKTLPKHLYRRSTSASMTPSAKEFKDSSITVLCFLDQTRLVWNSAVWIFMSRGATVGPCVIDEIPKPLSPTEVDALILSNSNGVRPSSPTDVFDAEIPYPTCAPTVGDCIDSFESLLSLVDEEASLKDGDIIALCKDSNLKMDDLITILFDSITICCQSAAFECTMEVPSEGTSILVVFGADVTLRGIVFIGGESLDFAGGNIAIEASNGNHVIDQCEFRGGISGQLGGNLYVGDASSVQISNSVFTNGEGTFAGGNLAIREVDSVTLTNNRFTNGNATSGGNVRIGSVKTVVITKNLFDGGSGEFGGGLEIAKISDGGSVDISNNIFTNNVASDTGGAIMLVNYTESTVTTTITQNEGVSNTAPTCPDIALLPKQPGSPRCAQFTSSPVQTPAMSPMTQPVPSPLPQPVRSPSSLPVSAPQPSTNYTNTITIRDFFIALSSSDMDMEPTEDEISAIVTGTENYLRFVFSQFYANSTKTFIEKIELTLDRVAYNNPTLPPPAFFGEGYNIYMQFSNAKYTFTEASTQLPSLIYIVLLTDTGIYQDFYVSTVIRQNIGGSLSNVNSALYGTTRL